MTIRTFATATALLSLAAFSTAQVPNYEGFQVQVRSGASSGFNIPPLYSISNCTPVINNSGQVALRVFSPGAMSVWLGGNGIGGIVHQTADTEAIIGDVSLNDEGYLVWAETFGNNAPGVWQYDQMNGASYRTNRPLGTSAWTALEVNNTREIFFRSAFGSGNAYTSVNTANQVTFYAESSSLDPTSPWNFLFTPSSNNAGQIAAKVQRVAGGNEIRIWNADGSSTLIAQDTGADSSSPYTGFRNSGDLTDDGRYVFGAGLVGGGDGIFVSDGTTTIEIVRTTTEPDLNSIEFFAPRINNNGLVVFRGFDGSGKRSVFVGDGNSLVKVATEGTELETDMGTLTIGRTDSNPAFGSSPDINDDGLVVFAASVTDGLTNIGTAITIALIKPTIDCPADVTGDGQVNLADLNLVLANFGQTTDEGDTNGDGIVNLADLNAVLAVFGTSCG